MALTTRYVSSAGTDTYANSTNSATPMSLTEAFANAAAGDLIMVKADGTYSRAASDTPTNSGTAAAPIIYRGYSSTITDGNQGRTNGNGAIVTTNFPTIAYGNTFRLIATAKNYTCFENLNITGAVAAALFQIGPSCIAYHCKAVNSINNGNAEAINGAVASGLVFDCDAECTGASSQAAINVAVAGARAIGCRAKATGNLAILANAAVVAFCVVHNSAVGIQFSTSGGLALNCTGYNLTTRLISTPNSVASPATVPVVINCHVTDSAYFCDSLYFGTSVVPIFRAYNRTRDNTNADRGFGDWPDYGGITTDNGSASSDYNDAASNDYRLVGSAVGKGAGAPSYLDCGALQRQESGGGATPGSLNGGIHQ